MQAGTACAGDSPTCQRAALMRQLQCCFWEAFTVRKQTLGIS